MEPLTLGVPMGCKEAYQKADGWNRFYEIVELTPEIMEEWEADMSSIGSITAGGVGVTVRTAGGAIVIEGGDGSHAQVYGTDGRLAASVTLSGSTRVELPRGLYIVKAAGTVAKVAL